MITYTQLERVRKANARLSDNTKKKITEVIERTKPQGEDALRRAILEELAPVMAEADEIAAQMSAAMYNGWRFAALGLTTDTVTQSAYDQKKVEAMANTAAKAAREGETVEAVINIVNGRASYDIRKSYGDTIMANAGRDKHDVRFARIPGTSEHYADGCPFCRMLASRGFVYHSKATAGEFGHYHDGCTCEIVAQFDKNPKVEGYDPDAYYDEYLAARDYAKTHFGGKTITAEDIARAYREMGAAGKIKAASAAAEKAAKDFSDPEKAVLDSMKEAYERMRVKDGLNLVPIGEIEDEYIPLLFKTDIGKLSYAEEVAKQFDNLASRFKTTARSVRIAQGQRELGQNGLAFTSHFPMEGRTEIILKPFKAEKLIQRVKTGVESGLFALVDEKDYMKYVTTHEFGHTLININMSTKNFIGVDEKRQKSIQKSIKNLFSEYKKEVGGLQKEIDKYDKKINETGDIEKILDYMAKSGELREKLREVKISDYSMEDENEFFAEAFTYGELGKGNNKYSKSVMDIINKHFSV